MKKKFFKILCVVIFFTFIPYVVYSDDENLETDPTYEDIPKTVIETSSNSFDFPKINARHAVVFDRNSKRAIYKKKENEPCKMASTTKIMTAIVVLENCNLLDTVEISSNSAQIGGSRVGLSSKDKISVENLLYGLMLKSGNDAAIALAEHVGGTVENFVAMMNNKAKSLNLLSTNFVTPHGLDNKEHYTTAFELAILTDYALQNETFAKIVKTKTYTILINGNPKLLSNTNELLGNYSGIYGVKTGFTNGANRCLVTSCKHGDLDIICVVLGCDTKKNRTHDSIKLLDYIFKNFSLINTKDILSHDFENWYITNKNCFTIYKGISNELNLYLDSSDFKFSYMAINNCDINNVETEISFNPCFEAPFVSGNLVGTIVLKVNSSVYSSISIKNSNSIPRKNIFNYIFYIFRNYCNFFSN